MAKSRRCSRYLARAFLPVPRKPDVISGKQDIGVELSSVAVSAQSPLMLYKFRG